LIPLGVPHKRGKRERTHVRTELLAGLRRRLRADIQAHLRGKCVVSGVQRDSLSEGVVKASGLSFLAHSDQFADECV
jgi:hypothetical protein